MVFWVPGLDLVKSVCVCVCVSYAGAFTNIGLCLKSWPAVVALSRGYGLGTKATL